VTRPVPNLLTDLDFHQPNRFVCVDRMGQAPYDERVGTSPAGNEKVVFFFHYLQIDRPFESAYGQLAVPSPTALPVHLRSVSYEPP
jgi:hypothetical protein